MGINSSSLEFVCILFLEKNYYIAAIQDYCTLSLRNLQDAVQMVLSVSGMQNN